MGRGCERVEFGGRISAGDGFGEAEETLRQVAGEGGSGGGRGRGPERKAGGPAGGTSGVGAVGESGRGGSECEGRGGALRDILAVVSIWATKQRRIVSPAASGSRVSVCCTQWQCRLVREGTGERFVAIGCVADSLFVEGAVEDLE